MPSRSPSLSCLYLYIYAHTHTRAYMSFSAGVYIRRKNVNGSVAIKLSAEEKNESWLRFAIIGFRTSALYPVYMYVYPIGVYLSTKNGKKHACICVCPCNIKKSRKRRTRRRNLFFFCFLELRRGVWNSHKPEFPERPAASSNCSGTLCIIRLFRVAPSRIFESSR